MSRETTRHPARPGERFHGLDTLRALAIVAVVLYHLRIQDLLPPALVPFAEVGWAGVDLFFVLSGFLIGTQLLEPYARQQRPAFAAFYARRAFRILPAFAAVMLLYLLLPLWREAPGPYAPAQYLTFTWNLLLLGYPEQRAFSHVWSLCVEEHFYLLLPLLLAWGMRGRRRRHAPLLVAMLLAAGVLLRAALVLLAVHPAGWPLARAWGQRDQQLAVMRFVYYPTYARLDGLTLGVAMAAARLFRPAAWARWVGESNRLAVCGWFLAVAALALSGFGSPSADDPAGLLFSFPLLALGFASLVASALAPGGWLRKRVPGARALATLSYTLYLTHKSVAHAVHQLLPELTREAGWRSLWIYALACLGVAAVLHFAVERPCLRLHTARREAEEEMLGDPAI